MVIAIIQARMGSNRLPGKIMKEVCGKPLLELQLERVRRVRNIDKIVVATTNKSDDDPVVVLCSRLGIDCFRGQEEDVLDRYYQAALKFASGDADDIVRITADCPLLDPEVIDRLIELYLHTGVDYASNGNPPTFPDGLDGEVFKFKAMEKGWQEANLQSEREHVTAYLAKHPEEFTFANLKNEQDLSHLRWTVDEAEDLELVQIIYESLYPNKKDFDTADILALLEKNPYLSNINNKFHRNEGYEKSLREDKLVEWKSGLKEEG